MFVIDLLFTGAIVMGIVGLARWANSKPATGGKPASRRPPSRTQARTSARKSLFVTAWNASGAQKLETTRLSEAVAELTGRTAGGLGRASKRKAKSARDRAEERWTAREPARPMFWRLRKPEADPAEQADEVKPADAGKPAAEQADAPPPAKPPAGKAADAPHDSKPTDQGDTPVATPFRPAPAPLAAAGTVLNVSGAWPAVIANIADLVPESDHHLLTTCKEEISGVLGYASAWAVLHETCINAIGLDPASVQGVAEFAEHLGECSARLAEAHQQFMTVYAEIMQAVANGVVLPYNGRFMTGEAS
jgi:hypothetical protein